MADDIVTRLRNNFATKDYPMLKDHCHSCAIPKEWGGHHDNCLYDQAADEIERLRAEVKALKSMISPAPNPEYRYFVHPDAASTYAQLLRGEFND